MRSTMQCWKYLCGILIGLAVAACASVPDLRVHYQLPPPSRVLEGVRLTVAVEDARPSPALLGPDARRRFGSFSGNLGFSLARHRESGFLIGVFDVPDLLEQGLRRRLENAGAQITSQPSAIQFRAVIHAFSLEVRRNVWTARIEYEARLEKEGRLLATQLISAQGERFGLIGHAAADEVLGEMFTEAVNRLNLDRLLAFAGLSR